MSDTFKEQGDLLANLSSKPVQRISDKIRNRLKEAEIPYMANDPIGDFILPGEQELLQEEVEGCIRNLLDALVIDQEKDPNSIETAKRVAKMYVQEVMMGRYSKKPSLTSFPNTKKLNEMLCVGPIKVRSMCSHHLVPIIGEAWVGVLPGEKLIGLSKFNRLAHWVMSRPQIQEEALIQFADELEKELKPIGVAVVMRADHMCMKWRGVKDDSTMANAVMRGIFLANPAAKVEFLELIKGMGY